MPRFLAACAHAYHSTPACHCLRRSGIAGNCRGIAILAEYLCGLVQTGNSSLQRWVGRLRWRPCRFCVFIPLARAVNDVANSALADVRYGGSSLMNASPRKWWEPLSTPYYFRSLRPSFSGMAGPCPTGTRLVVTAGTEAESDSW